MAAAMRGDFVPAGDDAAEQSGVPLRDPAKHEERGMDAGCLEQRQQAVDIALYPACHLVPMLAGEAGGERFDLEIILDINGHRVDRSAYPRRAKRAGIRQTVL